MVRRGARAVTLGVGLVVALTSGEVRAQTAGAPPPDEPRPLAGQRNVGILATIGQYQGFGGGLQVGARAAGFRTTFGWAPVLAFLANSRDPARTLRFYSTWQLAPDFYVRFAETRKGADFGGLLGYRYVPLLGHGGALGGYARFALGAAFDGVVSGGLLLFPRGNETLREKEGLGNAAFGFPGPAFNVAINLGVAFFP